MIFHVSRLENLSQASRVCTQIWLINERRGNNSRLACLPFLLSPGDASNFLSNCNKFRAISINTEANQTEQMSCRQRQSLRFVWLWLSLCPSGARSKMKANWLRNAGHSTSLRVCSGSNSFTCYLMCDTRPRSIINRFEVVERVKNELQHELQRASFLPVTCEKFSFGSCFASLTVSERSECAENNYESCWSFLIIALKDIQLLRKLISTLFLWGSNRRRLVSHSVANLEQRTSSPQMFLKEIMFVIFISTQRAVTAIQTIAERADDNCLKAVTLLFFHVHQLVKAEKIFLLFVTFPTPSLVSLSSSGMFCPDLIIECGACLGLELKYFVSELFFCLFLCPTRSPLAPSSIFSFSLRPMRHTHEA